MVGTFPHLWAKMCITRKKVLTKFPHARYAGKLPQIGLGALGGEETARGRVILQICPPVRRPGLGAWRHDGVAAWRRDGVATWHASASV